MSGPLLPALREVAAGAKLRAGATVLALLALGVTGIKLVLARGAAEGPRVPAGKPERAGSTPRADRRLQYAHTLKKGESLSAVAARAGVTVKQIVGLNRLRDPDRVRPGMTLILRPLLVRGRDGRERDLLAGLGPEDVGLEVFKAERRLEVRVRGLDFKSYRIGLGRNPVGDKRIEGDGRTPEGDFYVCQKLPAGRYGPSLGISYPGGEDAERGRREGAITAARHRAILESISARRKPPWDTPLGGAICIHGRGSSEDWTAGCIALDDEDAGELFALTPMGATVKILPGRRTAGSKD